MKLFFSLFAIFSILSSTAFAEVKPQGYCFKEAVKYKNLLHTQRLIDLELDSIDFKTQPLKYSQERYALDNFQETFEFTHSYGSEEDGYSDYKYKVTVEGWLNADNQAHICDVLGLEFSTEARY